MNSETRASVSEFTTPQVRSDRSIWNRMSGMAVFIASCYAGPSRPVSQTEGLAICDVLLEGKREIENLNVEINQLIASRDRAEAMADKLAEKIATEKSLNIGEHSSVNCPWQNALDGVSEQSP